MTFVTTQKGSLTMREYLFRLLIIFEIKLVVVCSSLRLHLKMHAMVYRSFSLNIIALSRALCRQLYTDLHNVQKVEIKAFLAI